VLEAAMVHPVHGPAIANGVVIVRGDRILAVGKAGEVEIPEGASVRRFPDGHIYPGLVDAATDAYTDDSLRSDGGLDAGTALSDGLQLRRTRDDELLAAGITTAYVGVRSMAPIRGQGAIVRPRREGFDLWRNREQAGVHLRMTNGPQPSHALQRIQQLDSLANALDGLEEYRKAQDEHEKALEKYKKEFADYLAFHQKKKDADKPKEAPATKENAAPAAGSPPAGAPRQVDGPPGERRRPPGGRGGEQPPRDPGMQAGAEVELAIQLLLEANHALAAGEHPATAQDPVKQEPPKQDPAKPAPAAAQQPGGDKPAEKKDEGPKRPTYPKAPAKDPSKEALLRVIDGELPLRVEAHRPEELRAALQLQAKYNVPLLVLEHAYGAASLVDDLAQRGASVVLTEVLPNSMPKLYEQFDVQGLPARLQAAGVPFAIASGSASRASLLPLMAAAAVAKGLDREAALRAITLTPAEILGVAKDTGSLQAGKYADVLVCDRPLFASDCRVLFVLSQGRPEFEAK
jgi:imidazolonepropionase-like amidohydrolase